MRLLVTGASGFVGRRLVPAARARWPQAEVTALGGPGDVGGVDVTDPSSVDRAVAQARPTHVVHLAAMAAVTEAARNPRTAFAVNLNGTLNLLEALKAHAPDAFLLHVSSAEVYGRSLREGGGRPVGEDALLQPVNAYAASKAAADLLVQAAAAEGLHAVVARPFNHVGAGQAVSFVVPAFAAQIAQAEAGLQPPVVCVGRLEDGRDFLAVDDVVAAYLLLLEGGAQAAGGVFNIASGSALSIGEVLGRLLRLARIPLEVRSDPCRLRPGPPAVYIGDATRLRTRFAWRPSRDFDAALAEVLEEQRDRVVVRDGQ